VKVSAACVLEQGVAVDVSGPGVPALDVAVFHQDWPRVHLDLIRGVRPDNRVDQFRSERRGVMPHAAALNGRGIPKHRVVHENRRGTVNVDSGAIVRRVAGNNAVHNIGFVGSCSPPWLSCGWVHLRPPAAFLCRRKFSLRVIKNQQPCSLQRQAGVEETEKEKKPE